MNVSDDDRTLRAALADALEGVGKDSAAAIAALKRAEQRTRRMIRALVAIGAIIGATLLAVMAALITVADTQGEVEAVQQRTSDQVLCPLYELFIRSEKNPQVLRQQPGETREQQAKRLKERAAQFKIIHKSYDVLECGK